MTERKGLLPEDDSEIEVVPDERRHAWLTDEEKAQPKPPSKADTDAMYERIRARREAERFNAGDMALPPASGNAFDDEPPV